MKNWIVLLITIISFYSCEERFSKKNDNVYYIIGKLDNVSDSTQVYLKLQESNTIFIKDTTKIINNTFEFKGKINKPEIFGIYIDSLKGSIGLFIENDSVFIDVDKNNLNNSKIRGSQLNDKYLEFISKSNEIISKTNYLFPLFQKARTENNADKLKEINKKINAIHQENSNYIITFAKENPNSYISAFAINSILKDKSISLETIESIYSNFSPEVKKGDFSIEILLFIENQKK